MKVFGLYGESGSGKSHIAERIAQEIGATLLIDDGLLVSHGHVLAGHSAKFESTRMGAVKRAIFADLEHRKVVRRALDEVSGNPSLLILGTSQRMIQLICESIGIEGEITWIPVESVVGPEELSLAQNLRNYGMHAIPIVEAMVEETRLRQLLERIRVRMLRHEDPHGGGRDTLSRRTDTQASPPPTIVNPLFAGGAVYIHPRAIRQSILQLIEEEKHPFQISRVSVDIGQHPKVLLRVRISKGRPIMPATEHLIARVRHYLATYLGLSIVELQVQVTSVVLPDSPKA